MHHTLTRRVTFAAAHRYRIPGWSDEENARRFGPCARPNYHGHSYICDVTVSGTPDEITGMLVDLALLDRILDDEVRQRFDHANINLDVPEFADGRLVPTGEMLAQFIFGKVEARLRDACGDGVSLDRVTIAEDQTLSASVSRL